MSDSKHIDGIDYAVPAEDSAAEAQAAIEDEFSLFDDWMDRYQYLIDLGKRLPGLPEAEQVDVNKVSGCQSEVWFVDAETEGRLYFQGTSDAMIVRGLIALLLRVYSGRTPAEITATQPHFIENIGLASHLSPTRSNGLRAMLERIMLRARQA